jgi:hypothetical protein
VARLTKRIGLSLGADICWPICFEEILRRLDLAIDWRGDTLSFEVERVTIEPFDLKQPVRYDLVIDRLTHWYHTSREWIKKAVVLNDTYVFNNPWSLQSNEKHTTYCAMMRLGLAIPDTWMLPPKAYEQTADLQPTLTRYAQLFDLGEIGRKLGYPLFMKPYDGGGWVGVNKIDDEKALREAYDKSGKFIMHLQQGIFPFDAFVRCIGVGPQTKTVKYDPAKPLHERYLPDEDFLSEEDESLLEDTTLTINSFFGWDFNTVEALRRDGVFHPIDFANPCPDSQVNSIHYHWPWYVTSNLKWALFVAATKRPMRKTLDFEPYYAIARKKDLPYREKLRGYAKIARERLSADAFAEFCQKHMGPVEQAARQWFRSDRCRDAVRKKVAHIYPAHEVDEFTTRFYGLVQQSVSDQEKEARQ